MLPMETPTRPPHHPMQRSSLQNLRALARTALPLFLASCAATRAVTDDELRALAPIASEASGWQRTSTHAEVDAFLGTLAAFEHAERLDVSTFGSTNEGRELAQVVVARPMPSAHTAAAAGERLRVLVNGNIHGGEVEGKEAIQMLLREFAAGRHAELLDDLVIDFVPIYNADGNERLDAANRVTQNGPNGGVGERANAQGLDLNRDFIKAESPECRALLGVLRTFDPHVFMDLHTTNGSYHGYHLTYSPSLSTNVDPAIDRFARGTWIEEIRAAMLARHALRVFDYGNFTGDEGDAGAQGEREWITYDHRPRFGTNYYGLRNRFSLLSEAYSYCDFETRVLATRAFVLETLAACARHAQELRALCDDADRRARDGDFTFGTESTLADPIQREILVGAIDELELPDELGTRRIARPEFHTETMGVRSAFVSARRSAAPLEWIVPSDNTALVDAVADRLALHGVAFERLGAARSAVAASFVPTEVRVAPRPFQGHSMVTLVGAWGDARSVAVPAGSLVVPARQALGRLASQLLDPESEDSLATWNVLDAGIRASSADGPGAYPVLRVPGS